LPFYYEWRGDRVTLVRPRRASHTFLPFSQFDASHARHVQQCPSDVGLDIETSRFFCGELIGRRNRVAGNGTGVVAPFDVFPLQSSCPVHRAD